MGLVLGKPLGIMLMLFIGMKARVISLPKGIQWKHIAATGFLAGIGFTMSIFITLLAFDNPALVVNSKIAVLFSSLIAAVVGFFFLKWVVRKHVVEIET